MNWIALTDENSYPKEEEIVLVRNGKDVTAAFYIKFVDIYWRPAHVDGPEFSLTFEPTHWARIEV